MQLADLPPETLEELIRLEREATPGPWKSSPYEIPINTPARGWCVAQVGDYWIGGGVGMSAKQAEEAIPTDAAFIPALRNAAPALLRAAQTLERLKGWSYYYLVMGEDETTLGNLIQEAEEEDTP